MLITTTSPAVELVDEEGADLGTWDNPIATKYRTLMDVLEEILEELKEMHEFIRNSV